MSELVSSGPAGFMLMRTPASNLTSSRSSKNQFLVWVVLGGQDADNFVEFVMFVALIGATDDAGGVDGGSTYICESCY